MEGTGFPLAIQRKGNPEGKGQISQTDVGSTLQSGAQAYLNMSSASTNLNLIATAGVGQFFYYLLCCLSPNTNYETKTGAVH